MDYLLKTEPTVYSFADLEREKTTIWDGVTNPAAVKHLRGMKPGERLVIYHTGDEKSAVGTASVVAVDASDAKNPQVRIKAGKAIAKVKTLAEIKGRAGGGGRAEEWGSRCARRSSGGRTCRCSERIQWKSRRCRELARAPWCGSAGRKGAGCPCACEASLAL